jgi:AcrR family transcriptional regulator
MSIGRARALRDSGATKARIERAALELFARRGIEETGIRDIAAEAQIALGAMYAHYPSKQELAEVLFAENFHRIGAALEAIADGPGSLRERLAAMIAHVFKSFDQDAVSLAFLFRARQEYAGRVRPGHGDPYLAFRKLVVGATKQAKSPAQSPTVTTAMVIGIINQLVDTHMLGRVRGKLSDLTETVTNAALRILEEV